MLRVTLLSYAENNRVKGALSPTFYRWEIRPRSEVCSRLPETKVWSLDLSLLGGAGDEGDADAEPRPSSAPWSSALNGGRVSLSLRW